MVSTRSKDHPQSSQPSDQQAGEKRSAPSTGQRSPKKSKKASAKDDDGQQTLEENLKGEGNDKEPNAEEEVKKVEVDEGKEAQQVDKVEKGDAKDETQEEGKPEQDEKAEPGGKAEEPTPTGDDKPKHGTLEAGHIYFLYRPKVETEDPESIDDVSKFHILLIPKSGPHSRGHYHRIIEVGKKKLPDPKAKHQVIWGLVGGIGTDKTGLKEAFGASTYETKTRGTRHQPAARPAARGHYILHSPRDELADSPSHDRQRDYKVLLAYEITTPAHDDFGSVQAELGIEEKGAVVIQVKDPDAESRGNPRAAGIPREKRAQYPPSLHDLFRGRRFIPPNPLALLDYPGAEVLLITSPHALSDSLGGEHGNGDEVEHDLDADAAHEGVDVDGALKELGLNKSEFEQEALEGSWA